MDIVTQTQILEVLSAADPSAGWCAMIGSDSGYYAAALADADARELYPNLDAITAGWVIPAGTLEVRRWWLPTLGALVLRQRWTPRRRGRLVVRWYRGRGSPPRARTGNRNGGLRCFRPSRSRCTTPGTPPGCAGRAATTTPSTACSSRPGIRSSLDGPRRDGALYRWPGLFIANLVAVPLGAAGDALTSRHGVPGREGQHARHDPDPGRAASAGRYRPRTGDDRLGPQLRLRHSRPNSGRRWRPATNPTFRCAPSWPGASCTP